MKLLDKYNRLNITATILTFLIGSCTFYFVLNYILISEIDETLQTEQQETLAYVKTHNALPEIIPTKDQYISFTPTTPGTNTIFITLGKTLNKEEEPFREIQFTVKVGDRYYLARVDKPLEETESLLQVIIIVTIAMIAVILLIGFLFNRIVIRRLWKPFYQTIDAVKGYHLTDQRSLALERVEVDEFLLLNITINEMMERIQDDYGALKNFTGQAAHEMQTPLAIIRSKLDLLMQNEAVLEKNGQNIADIEKAVHRLSRLHQSLLLLTKVENKQFKLDEQVSLNMVIADKCAELAEMTEAMHISVNLELQPVTILFHQHLAEIMINNLLSNAVRYNMKGGKIDITLTADTLTICNTSNIGQIDQTQLFKRFYRGSTAEDGNGLGLSIVKQICDLAGFSISYSCVDCRHGFTIKFYSPPF